MSRSCRMTPRRPMQRARERGRTPDERNRKARMLAAPLQVGLRRAAFALLLFAMTHARSFGGAASPRDTTKPDRKGRVARARARPASRRARAVRSPKPPRRPRRRRAGSPAAQAEMRTTALILGPVRDRSPRSSTELSQCAGSSVACPVDAALESRRRWHEDDWTAFRVLARLVARSRFDRRQGVRSLRWPRSRFSSQDGSPRTACRRERRCIDRATVAPWSGRSTVREAGTRT